jgi:dolichol-phosphate mannosyltransferase
MKLSIIIPAHNEADCIRTTVSAIARRLAAASIDYEIVVVNDGSTDRTPRILEEMARTSPAIIPVDNTAPNGFGFAVRKGLEAATGEAMVIVMADASDDPEDIVRYYRQLEAGYDCAFGSRFVRDARVNNYPYHKLLLNRLANVFIRILFGLRYNDITNAFKAYRREVIEGVKPILSNHFNLTVELPLKAIVRGYSYTVIPTNWTGRETGISKLKIKEMGSRYLFIVLYVWLEKWLSRGDYVRVRKGDQSDHRDEHKQ